MPILAVVAAGMVAVAVSVCAAAEVPSASGADYERPDAAAVKAETEQILADPRFAPRRSAWQWLIDKLLRWGSPQIDWASPWTRFVLWVLVIACCMTLAAILGHLVWTIVTLVKGRRARGAGADGWLPHFGQIPPEATYEHLEAMRRAMVAEGRFREAIGVMMAALLRWLETRGAVQCHQSKTNGDYVREFPPDGRGRDAFGRFVRAFDGTVYAGAPCNVEVYGQLDSLFERVRTDVRQEP